MFSPQRGNLSLSIRMQGLDSINTDFELLAQYLIELIDGYEGPFEIILDCTGHTSNANIPLHWILALVDQPTSRATNELLAVFIFNPSNDFQRYFRKVLSLVPGM